MQYDVSVFGDSPKRPISETELDSRTGYSKRLVLTVVCLTESMLLKIPIPNYK